MIPDQIENECSGDDWWKDLSAAQKAHINEGIDDAENGRVISSAEFWVNLKTLL